MKGRVKSGLGLTIGADIEEEAASEDTLMAEDDNSEDVMEETAAEDTGPPPIMVTLTARHYNVQFKANKISSNQKKELSCKNCDHTLDNKSKLEEHIVKHHAEDKEIDAMDTKEDQIQPTLSHSEQEKDKEEDETTDSRTYMVSTDVQIKLTHHKSGKLRLRKNKKAKQTRTENSQAGDGFHTDDLSELYQRRKKNKVIKVKDQKKTEAKSEKLDLVNEIHHSVYSALDAINNEGNTNSREVKCDQCGEIFNSVQNLNVHKFHNTC